MVITLSRSSKLGKKGIGEMKEKRKTGKSQETEALLEGLPWCPVIKNLPSNARDMDSIPGQGLRIPHAMRQISPCAATKKSARPLQSEKACSQQ